MDKLKLNYRFHQPNIPEQFIRMLLNVCIEANMKRAEQAANKYVLDNMTENGDHAIEKDKLYERSFDFANP